MIIAVGLGTVQTLGHISWLAWVGFGSILVSSTLHPYATKSTLRLTPGYSYHLDYLRWCTNTSSSCATK